MAGFEAIIAPSADLDAAKAFYAALLGVDPYIDEKYYVGFRLGEQEFGLDPHGHRHGLTAYLAVDDIEDRVAALLAAGGTETQGVRDVGGGMKTAVVTDPNGNVVGLRQAPSGS